MPHYQDDVRNRETFYTQAPSLVAITVFDYRMNTSKLILLFHVHF